MILPGRLTTNYIAVLLGITCIQPALAAPTVHRSIDWPTFLAQQDPVWQTVPATWEESPFLGNGWMGTMVYQNGRSNPRQLRFDVHHAGVHDHQDGSGMFATARLPIGYFTIDTVGEMKHCDLRLDLWNAELRGTVTTSKGALELRAIVHANKQLLVVEVTPDAGEKNLRWTFHPAVALSPRAAGRPRNQWPPEYKENPPYELLANGDVSVCRQRLTAGGEHATAWRVVEGKKETLFASVVHSFPDTAAVETAVDQVEKSASRDYESLLPAHRKWWHNFYPTSFVSIPDPFWQSFYWIQMYKLGAATRADGCLIDNHGPWLQDTPWPYATWNLNVQLTYWPFNASGHQLEASSLTNHLSDHRNQLRKNVLPPEYRADSYAIGRAATENLTSPLRESSHNHFEIGNLPWALHNVWLQYRHTMNDQMLQEALYPLLKGSINFYLHVLEEDENGILHLPTTYSPEYGDAQDCNYDLSLLRWGCQTLLWIDNRLELHDAQASEWRNVLRKLAAYPGDEQQGYYIGRDAPYSKSHRHYSHLLMIYPLYLVNVDQPTGREQIERSVAHWHSLPNALLGYSFTGSASMFAALGDGDRALAKLNGLGRFLQPNTMYREGGPVIETPLSAAQSIHDMLIQSWGDRIRVFPAVPAKWRDVAIDKLRTEGAFEVSALRKEGKTEWVKVRSLAGEPMEIDPGIKGQVTVLTNGNVDKLEQGHYLLRLDANQTALFHYEDSHPDLTIAPVIENYQPQFGLPDDLESVTR